MAAATRTADGVVAVGRVGAVDEADAAVWTHSGDGWSLATPPALGGDHEQWAFDVASGSGGLLVAGGENVWGEVRPRLWFSADGADVGGVDGGPGGPFDGTGEESVRRSPRSATASWPSVPAPSTTSRTASSGTRPTARPGKRSTPPTCGGRAARRCCRSPRTDGGLVAGGMSDLTGDGQGDPVVWRSADGLTWDPVSASCR